MAPSWYGERPGWHPSRRVNGVTMTEIALGEVLGPVRVGPVAHGGHWVGRLDGRVYFIRHALADELVRIRVTGVARRHAFADAVEILEPSPWRVDAPCPVASMCGGCDFQHVDPAHQPELKRQVVAEQLHRLAGIEWAGSVESVGSGVLGWRTRMRYHSGPDAWGLRRSRSHEVVPLPDDGCRLAVEPLARPINAPGNLDAQGNNESILGTAAADGVRWTVPGEAVEVTESAAGRSWRVSTEGFWQVHPLAPDTLVQAVLDGLGVRAGERALDLYCGVGLFAGALTDAGAEVTGIEGNRDAVRHAEQNVPQARFHAGSVERVLKRLDGPWDLAVLDPPRRGAGADVLTRVLSGSPRAVAYVACDPAGLARDLATAATLGYRTTSLRAFDLFGSTHHVECVAVLRPDEA